MRTTALACVLLISTLAGTAGAQTVADKATAQALFDAAKQLIVDGKYSEACPKFAESQRLDPAPGTLLNLADCYEKSGMTASAWATWLEAAAATHSAGQADRERVARERAAALKPKLVSITISVAESNRVAGLNVERDGSAVGMATWGTAVPVDPGSHSVVVSAPGRRTWQTTVTVSTATKPVVVTVPALELEQVAKPLQTVTPVAPPSSPPAAIAVPQPSPPAAAATPTPAPAAVPAAKPTPLAPAAPLAAAPVQPAASSLVAVPGTVSAKDAGTSHSSTQRTLAYVIGGAGVVGIGIGAIFGLEANSKNDDSLSKCRTETVCGKAGYDLRQQALDAAKYSTVAFGIGSAALVAGILLLATAPSSHPVPARAGWSVSPVVKGSTGAITVEGAF